MITNISWTDETWNPVVGCSKVSEGCLNCYAERMAHRLACMGQEKYQRVTGYISEWDHWLGNVYCDKSALDKPLHWRKPRRIFVCSMGDLFHPDVPFEFVARVTDVIRKCPQHNFQILTKRSQRMHNYFHHHMQDHYPPEMQVLSNLWLGVTCENQKRADERIPILLKIPAAKRFVSLEPLLGPVDLTKIKWAKIDTSQWPYDVEEAWSLSNVLTSWAGDKLNSPKVGLDQVIIGCESMPGGRVGRFQDGFVKAAIDIVRQCKAAGVKVHVKQVPIKGRVSHNMSASKYIFWPEELRVQEMI